MARRYPIRRIKIHRCYSVAEVANLLDVHKHTVSRWIATGLPLIEKKRPYLIHGADLRVFLTTRQPRRQLCRPGEIFCIRCRAPKRPAGDMVDYLPRTPATGILQGICPTCNLLINRAARFTALASVCADLNVTHQNPQQRLVDSPGPFRNVAFAKESQ